jgi:hypothetical protein
MHVRRRRECRSYCRLKVILLWTPTGKRHPRESDDAVRLLGGATRALWVGDRGGDCPLNLLPGGRVRPFAPPEAVGCERYLETERFPIGRNPAKRFDSTETREHRDGAPGRGFFHSQGKCSEWSPPGSHSHSGIRSPTFRYMLLPSSSESFISNISQRPRRRWRR